MTKAPLKTETIKAELKDRIPSIRAEDVMRFFWTKRPSETCVVCGSDDIGTPAEIDGTSRALLIHTLTGETAYPAYMIGCGNCGHMHLFAERVVSDWVEKHGAK